MKPAALLYGNKILAAGVGFDVCGRIRKQLIEQGYDKNLLHTHYEHTVNHFINRLPSNSRSEFDEKPVQTKQEAKDTVQKTLHPENSETMEKYIIRDFKDATWLNNYVDKMGEDNFWQYKRKVYAKLRELNTGQSLYVCDWCKPENLDLFVKICDCFISENKTYRWENGYIAITNKYTQQELDRDKKLFELFKNTRNEIAETKVD